MNWIYRVSVWVASSLFMLIFASNMWIYLDSRSQVGYDVQQVPKKKVALVLGTSKSRVSGGSNSFFTHRMEAVARLYHKGLVDHVIVSGDNRSVYYNEPRDMKEALLELGIPEVDITQDFAGLRTLDSVVRCKMIFGQDDVIIVTQEFHLFRALFIANYYNMNAIGYPAEAPDEGGLKVFFRELVARPLAIYDLYFIDTQPRHMGDEIEIEF